MFTPSILLLLASAGLIEARSLVNARHIHEVQRRANNDATATTLAANAIQSGSFVDGSKEIGANEAQQAKSQTSTNNFINFCAGKTLSNGLQITGGSCNGIPMGDLPAKTNMVSSIITFPPSGSKEIQSDTTFNISVQMSNLVAGSFTNADATYFSAPQFLQGGKIVGHTHVTVQDLGSSLNPKQAPDPTQFAFFKGINDAGNGQGLLQAVVTGGLPAGNYRVCTMASASNHQPVIMPVAQRGTADDCTKFTVVGNGKVANDASNNGVKGQAAASLAAAAVANGAGNVDPALASSTAASKATSTANTGNGKGNGKGGKATTTAAASSAKATSTTTAASSAKGNAATSVASSAKASTTAKATSVASSAKASSTKATSSNNKAALGGKTAPAITDSGDSARPFKVNGNTFVNKSAAVQRACDIQLNACDDAFNAGGASFTLADCSSQQTACVAAGGA